MKNFTFSSLCKVLGPFKLRRYSFEQSYLRLVINLVDKSTKSIDESIPL